MSDMPTSSLGSEKPALLDISKVSEDSSKATSDFSNVLNGQMSGDEGAQGGNALPERGEVVLQNRHLQSGMRIKVSDEEVSEEGLAEFALSQGIDPRAFMMLQGANPTNSASKDATSDGLEQAGIGDTFLRTKIFDSSRAASIASVVSRTKNNSDVLDAAIEAHELLNNVGQLGHYDAPGVSPSLQLDLSKPSDEHISASEIEDDLSTEAVVGIPSPTVTTNSFALESKKFNESTPDQKFVTSVELTSNLDSKRDALKVSDKPVNVNGEIVKLSNVDSLKLNAVELRSGSEESLTTRSIPAIIKKDPVKARPVELRNSFTSEFGGSEVQHTIRKPALGEKIPKVAAELTGKHIDLLSKEDQLVTKSANTASESFRTRDFVGKINIRMGNQDLAERISYTKKLGIIEKMPPITVLSSATEQTQSASNSGNNAAIVSQQVSSVAPFVTLPSETGSSLTQSQSGGSLETSQHDLANDIMRRKEFQNQLSQRLSQALGQRLSAQIERGSWRVEMDLHPSSLGRVEVQLEMRNGELEANFLSSNPTTRDLLQESLPRLREMLDHFGTNTAYPGMGSGYKGQSDGNPAADGSSSQRSSDEEGKSLSSDMARKPVSDDGLDVMV